MSGAERSIRTPDQRLRVFVSSTLKELAEERRAVRAAVNRLHLAPVLFELGARPHPPRDLYRAYLEQSDVFVGLYWERYGWVAPGEEVSGLEDEYTLTPPGLPKLIYIKEPADAREPRLKDLLIRIRDDDTTSFKYFSSPSELAKLVEADLATLLAERFDESRTALTSDTVTSAPAKAFDGPVSELPAVLTELIGRDVDVEVLLRMLVDGARLVTLTGPGGIGKTRLGIEVARSWSQASGERAVFVPLAPVRDPDLVPMAIAQAIGLRDAGERSIVEDLALALQVRPVLLVLDNFEQVVAAAPTVAQILGEVPTLKVLATSRTLLRVNGERSFGVGSLSLPHVSASTEPDEVASSSAGSLFVERARAVKPSFELNSGNAQAVAEICLALDGVPLALELAAARTRIMSPESLRERLDHSLAVLIGGPRDLPTRQQTLRKTIEWSAELLDAEPRRMLSRISVFPGGFSLEAAQAVAVDSADLDAIDLLSDLVDSSLVSEQDREDSTWFAMLATVREYAIEQLTGDELAELRERQASYYCQLAARMKSDLEGPRQRELFQRLNDERDNLRTVARFLLDSGSFDRAADLAWALFVYWWVIGDLGEVRRWADEMLESAEALSTRTRAIATYFASLIGFWQNADTRAKARAEESAELFRRCADPEGEGSALTALGITIIAQGRTDLSQAAEAFEKALRLFHQSGHQWGESLALITVGRIALARGEPQEALERFEESLALTRERHDQFNEGIAIDHTAWAHLALGQPELAAAEFNSALGMSEALGHNEGIAYGLEAMAVIAALKGEPERAGKLLGASDSLRVQTGLRNSLSQVLYQPFIDQMVAQGGAKEFEWGLVLGRDLDTTEAVAYAHETSRGVEGGVVRG
ncbi:ATP-binding protein [Leifsonia sp. NPDC056824]|uniref:ATP-binding protein n=1 Tax=Leifsonia sp. NPDC056824 TaxID=3345953 RepID=UPI0036A74EDB